MTPILFGKAATDFDTNGVGRLSDCIECLVQENAEGLFELSMVYPVSGAHFDAIETGSIIVAKPSAKRNPQAFRVYRINRPLNGRVAIYARHISYQLSFVPVSPFSAVGLEQALANFKTAAIDCPFDFETDMASSASFTLPEPASMRSVMGGQGLSFLSVYGGIWEWDNWTCRLLQSRGEVTSIRIAYGKNLTELEQDEDLEKTYTAVYPYWISGSNRVELPEKIIRSEYADLYPFDRVEVIDYSNEFDAEPTAAQLRSAVQAHMAAVGYGLPTVNITLNFVNLADTIEYRDILTSENIDLCDIITVDFPKLGVHKEEQIISITWDVLNNRYYEIEVGDKRSTLAGTIEDQIETIETMPTTEAVQKQVDHATGILAAGRGGHVVLNRNSDGWVDEILVMDNADYALAQKVLRINQNGIGFSSDGYQGNFRQAWLLDGTLSLGGVNGGYGKLVLLNADGDEIGSFSATNGFEFTRGQEIGFKADGSTVYIGDFYVADEYGRQILQSTDERTGISGEPNHSDGYYFWANWRVDEQSGDELFGLIVDGQGAKVQWEDWEDHDLRTYNVGESLSYLLWKVRSLQDQIDELPSGTP